MSYNRKKSGFTLLEVLVAVILLAAGFIAILEATSTGFFSAAENENDLVATNLAQEKIEEERNRSFANVINEVKAPVSGFTAFQREVQVTTPQANLKQVTVIVYWNSKSTELNVSLVTNVSNV